jgi:hypothetical protein
MVRIALIDIAGEAVPEAMADPVDGEAVAEL